MNQRHIPVSRVSGVVLLGLLSTSLLLVLLALASAARADGDAVWHSAPAAAPSPPPGAAPAPYPVPVGPVGALSFWAPNRGLLITGGTEDPWSGPVAPGLYAYDGVGWHQLSTVCGGAGGRIAWAGPDEFWTIADQRAGQAVVGRQSSFALTSVSLCHFLDGAVVASYAMPLEQPDSYLRMNAAACLGPSDCWFGGQDGQGPSGPGAFHLHWDGSSLTTVYEPEDHAVDDMVDFAGKVFESVRIQRNDFFSSEENQAHPAVIHTIAPAGSENPFSDLFMFAGTRLPEYGLGVLPAALQGFSLATDGSPLGESVTQLWAAANPVIPSEIPSGSNSASLTLLRYAGGSWSQIKPALPAGVAFAGVGAQIGSGPEEQGTSEAVAPEPGTDRAWLSLTGESTQATVAQISADGTVSEVDQLPASQESVGLHGFAGPIVCPAAHDCWMASTGHAGSTVPGWLFHLSDGTRYPQDTDPNFAGVISYRPPDAGIPVIYPDVPPLDNSLSNQQAPPPPSAPATSVTAPTGGPTKARPLVVHVKSRFLHHRLLVIGFTLTARAHVQLIARRKGRVVARTPRESLRVGKHQLSLGLNPKAWPTGLQFKATPIDAATPTGGGSGSSNNTVSTG